MVDRAIFSKELNRVRELAPQMILSNHLPPAADMTELLLAHLPAVPDSDPFVGLDQPGLEAMLKGVRSG